MSDWLGQLAWTSDAALLDGAGIEPATAAPIISGVCPPQARPGGVVRSGDRVLTSEDRRRGSFADKGICSPPAAARLTASPYQVNRK